METRRVLIVDDEQSFTNLVKLNLEKTGRFTVLAENDPTRAVTTAREFHPAVVLLDVIMPGKDGGQVLADLRATEFAEIPALFLTATISQRGLDQRNGRINGVPFLSKPVDPKRLVKQIDELFANG